MNREFIDALNLLAAERNLDKDQLLTSFEEALEQAFERNVEPGKQIEVALDPESGEMEVLVIMRVVEEVEDPDKEISLQEALDLDETVEVGMEMEFPVDPERFTRIAVPDHKTGNYSKDSRGPSAPSCSRSTRTGPAMSSQQSYPARITNVTCSLISGPARQLCPPRNRFRASAT